MPSIAGFIHSLLSEDMHATGVVEKMDERIAQLNDGQLRLMVQHCEQKMPTLTSKTILDAYTKLLRQANLEISKRLEEEMGGRHELLRKLRDAHAGTNAKAWDNAHSSLDKELVKFQKFLKSKARRVAEEQVLQEEMDKLQAQLLSIPARRVAANGKRRFWWAVGVTLVAIFGPITFLFILPLGIWPAAGSYAACLGLGVICWFVGLVRGTVSMPTLDDDDLEDETRKRAEKTLKVDAYHTEVQQNYEEFEKAFAADMKWRDKWVRERRKKRRKSSNALRGPATRGNASRVAPSEGGEVNDNSPGDSKRGRELGRATSAGENATNDRTESTIVSIISRPCLVEGTSDAVRGMRSIAGEAADGGKASPSVDVERGFSRGSPLLIVGQPIRKAFKRRGADDGVLANDLGAQTSRPF